MDEWHHGEGAKNPADLGTRGLSFDDIANSNWIKGPDWLLQPILLNEDNQLPAEQNMNVQVYVAIGNWCSRLETIHPIQPIEANNCLDFIACQKEL